MCNRPPSTVHRQPSPVFKKMPETGCERPVSGMTEVNDVFVRFFISRGKDIKAWAENETWKV
jgi:hypothetical protein